MIVLFLLCIQYRRLFLSWFVFMWKKLCFHYDLQYKFLFSEDYVWSYLNIIDHYILNLFLFLIQDIVWLWMLNGKYRTHLFSSKDVDVYENNFFNYIWYWYTYLLVNSFFVDWTGYVIYILVFSWKFILRIKHIFVKEHIGTVPM